MDSPGTTDGSFVGSGTTSAPSASGLGSSYTPEDLEYSPLMGGSLAWLPLRSAVSWGVPAYT